jgi:argininosuccinate lyase
MPQKKNPDMAELLRGKAGRVYGNLMQILTVMKGTPLAYNKDFQEDKEGLFDTVETWRDSLRIFAKMLEKTEFRLDEIAKHLNKGFLAATDVAENLAKQGMPFREAHEVVGRMVKFCERHHKNFENLSAADLAEIDSRLSAEKLGDLSLAACVAARTSFGGTAPSDVLRQIGVGRQWLAAQEQQLENLL